MVAIVVEPSQALKVVSYLKSWASKRYSILSLDDQDSVSRSHVTTLYYISKFWSSCDAVQKSKKPQLDTYRHV